MREGVTISHRGSVYEIGRGRGFYGIWIAAAPQPTPVEWWPETQDGWYDAWARFTAIENPAAITAVDEPLPGSLSLASPRDRDSLRLGGVALLALGVIFGIIGLFPDYTEGASLSSSAPEWIPHVIYLLAWSASAALLLRSGNARRAGALVAAGTSAVTFGLFLADLGIVIADGTSQGGAGLVFSLVGWLACAAGSVLGLLSRRDGLAARPDGREAWLATTLAVIAGLGAALAFAPPWDSYVLSTPAGILGSGTLGNAFKNPGPVILGNVAVMVIVVAIVIIAALWRPVRQGAALLAGAAIPLAAQVISAIVQVAERTPPQLFGISPAEAARIDLTIDAGLTAAFWVFTAFVVALILLSVRMATTPAGALPTQASPYYSPGIQPSPGDAADPADAAGPADPADQAPTSGDSAPASI
ncbi:MAG TPA: hypothetical protein VMA95_04425 [Streptosporangiaceae bacterium]|nr:hypothetical protein [Streptosporangiaceae bacterium]